MNHKDPKIQPSWGFLERWGSSKILRTSYLWIFLVPVLAKLMDKLPETVNIQVLESVVTLNTSLPFSWILFYFSALAFGLASIFYSVFCPDLVKRVKDWDDFQNTGYTNYQLMVFFSNFLRNGGCIYDAPGNLVSGNEAVTTLMTKFCEKLPPEKNDVKEDWYRAKYLEPIEENEADAFWYIRGLMQKDKPCVRGLIFTLYLVGFALFSGVLIQNLCFVIGAI